MGKKVKDTNEATGMMILDRTLEFVDVDQKGRHQYRVSPPFQWRYVSGRADMNDDNSGRSRTIGEVYFEKDDLSQISDDMKNGADIVKGRKYVVNPRKLVGLLSERFDIEYDLPSENSASGSFVGEVIDPNEGSDIDSMINADDINLPPVPESIDEDN